MQLGNNIVLENFAWIQLYFCKLEWLWYFFHCMFLSANEIKPFTSLSFTNEIKNCCAPYSTLKWLIHYCIFSNLFSIQLFSFFHIMENTLANIVWMSTAKIYFHIYSVFMACICKRSPMPYSRIDVWIIFAYFVKK